MHKTSILILLILSAVTIAAEPLYTVTRIVDGDTLVIKTDDGDEKVRLYGIDTPEKGEPGYFEAAGALEALCLNQKVRLEYPDKKKRDNFGRLLAKVYLSNDKMVNELLLKSGLAKLFKKAPLKTKSSLELPGFGGVPWGTTKSVTEKLKTNIPIKLIVDNELNYKSEFDFLPCLQIFYFNDKDELTSGELLFSTRSGQKPEWETSDKLLEKLRSSLKELYGGQQKQQTEFFLKSDEMGYKIYLCGLWKNESHSIQILKCIKSTDDYHIKVVFQ